MNLLSGTLWEKKAKKLYIRTEIKETQNRDYVRVWNSRIMSYILSDFIDAGYVGTSTTIMTLFLAN